MESGERARVAAANALSPIVSATDPAGTGRDLGQAQGPVPTELLQQLLLRGFFSPGSGAHGYGNEAGNDNNDISRKIR